jgi:hypothetical protein
MKSRISLSKTLHFLKKKKFWFIFLLCIVLLVNVLAYYYESLRHRAKDLRNESKEAGIRLAYILAKNKSDIYNFAQKFSKPDNYNFDKIRPFWSEISFMYHVPYLMFQYKPNVHNPVVNTNNMGFRGTVNYSHLPSLKPDYNYRYIVLLGGSTAFGAYSSSDDKCISSVLEKMLNAEFKERKKFRVINLGTGFYNSFQELISYILYGLNFDPEVVITFDGFNSGHTPLIQQKRVPLAPGYYYKAKNLIHGINKRQLKDKEYKTYIENSSKELCEWDKESTYYVNDVAKLYRRNLDLICLISRERGIKVLLSLQPIKIFPDGKFAWEEEEVEKIYSLLPEVLERLSIKYKASFINFQKIFAENLSFNQYFICDPVHLNDRGQEIIATYMFHELKKIIDIKD